MAVRRHCVALLISCAGHTPQTAQQPLRRLQTAGMQQGNKPAGLRGACLIVTPGLAASDCMFTSCRRHQVWCTHMHITPPPHTHTHMHIFTPTHKHNTTPATPDDRWCAGRHVAASAGTASKAGLLKTLSPALSVSVERSWLCVPEFGTPQRPLNNNSTGNDIDCLLPPTIARVATSQRKTPLALLLPGSAHAAASACLSTKRRTTRQGTATQQCRVCWNPPKRNPSLVPTRAHLWTAGACADEGGCKY